MMLVTSNDGKYEEYREIFRENNEELSLFKKKYPEEQLDSLRKVVERSLYYLTGIMQEEFFIDDSGLFIESLNGFPGPYSSYVFKTLGNDGILKLMDKMERRNATFQTVIAFYDSSPHFFAGEVKGTIATSKRGDNGFGFDPIFMPSGSYLTFAEMSRSEKNASSHRANAASQFMAFLKKRKL